MEQNKTVPSQDEQFVISFQIKVKWFVYLRHVFEYVLKFRLNGLLEYEDEHEWINEASIYFVGYYSSKITVWSKSLAKTAS